MASRSRQAEAEVRAAIDAWASANRAKDLERVMSHYVPDAVSFDLAPPLQQAGAETIRRGLAAWFPTFRGEVGYEIANLVLSAGEDLAFARSFNRITGSRTSGEETDVWVRATLCFRKIGGAWKIVHEHVSVPFYMDGSDRAAVDLKP